MILTRQDMADLLCDLERDKHRQAPVTILLRRRLAELHQDQDERRLAEITLHLKHPGGTS